MSNKGLTKNIDKFLNEQLSPAEGISQIQDDVEGILSAIDKLEKYPGLLVDLGVKPKTIEEFAGLIGSLQFHTYDKLKIISRNYRSIVEAYEKG